MGWVENLSYKICSLDVHPDVKLVRDSDFPFRRLTLRIGPVGLRLGVRVRIRVMENAEVDHHRLRLRLRSV